MSYSRVKVYLQCPWMYHLMYQRGWRSGPTARASLGLTVHRTLEKYHKALEAGKDSLFEIYDGSWVNEGFSSPQETVELYERGRLMLENFLAFEASRSSRVIGTERGFSFRSGRFRFRGIIDRLDEQADGSYELIEYKTHQGAWDRSRIDSDLQMTLYSLACKKAWGLLPRRLSFLFLARGEYVPTQRSPEQEGEAWDLVRSVASKIARGLFEPHHDHCPKCEFRARCPQSSVRETPAAKADEETLGH